MQEINQFTVVKASGPLKYSAYKNFKNDSVAF